MATDHRGRDIHAGKRTDDEMHVSRLANLITTQKHDIGLTGATPEGVQRNLDIYRVKRDADLQGRDLSYNDYEFLGGAEKTISEAFKNRHNKDS